MFIQARPPKKRKKPTLTKAQKALAEAEAKMLARHAAPLELGARAKGIKVDVGGKSVDAPRIERRVEPVQSVAVNVGQWHRKMVGSTAPLKDKEYTGTECLGVSTMHKSNATPVFSQQEAIDIARMRRG